MQFRSIFAASALGLTLAATSVLPAFAHATIVDTTPSSGKRVNSIDEVSVTANEELLDIGKDAKGFALIVRDAAGLFYGDGCVTVKGTTASMPVSLTAMGHYSVTYRIVSNDGHPIEGDFSFDFAGDDTVDPAPAFADRPECGVEQTAVVADDDTNGSAGDESSEETNDETTDTPMVISESPASTEPASPNDMGVLPFVGLATVPVLALAIWLLVRTLGKRDSEDHLN